MTEDEQRRGPGRPRNPNKPTKSLAGVRVSNEQMQSYTNAAALKGIGRADWVRDALDRAAKAVMRQEHRTK